MNESIAIFLVILTSNLIVFLSMISREKRIIRAYKLIEKEQCFLLDYFNKFFTSTEKRIRNFERILEKYMDETSLKIDDAGKVFNAMNNDISMLKSNVKFKSLQKKM